MLRMQTLRLDLIAASLEHVQAQLAEPSRLAEVVGSIVPASWPSGEYDRDAQLFFRECLEVGGAEAVGWYGWYALRRAEHGKPLLVGAGGYFGPPQPDGTVEIGYSIVPEAQRQGYATELVQALVRRASASGRVTRILAHTTEQNRASIIVLERSGFERIGPGEQPGSIRFECNPPPPYAAVNEVSEF